jgi:hypothetical protein
MYTSTIGDMEKTLLQKKGDYNNDTRTLSRNPNPKDILTSLSPRINEDYKSLFILYCGTSLMDISMYIYSLVRFAVLANTY